ncbi:MAG TPA: hypothetical protein VGX92_19245 [Pyrinomonadaceae bacterium]|jgi:hypothetical protein|nr:hypothetical protein [Pyrinomonadaceae bacterium]
MKQSPRSNALAVSLILSAFLPLLLLLLAPHDGFAQQPQQQQRGRKRAEQSRLDKENKESKESKDAERARRLEAVALLNETADRARSLDDLFYRARIQLLAADALWDSDKERAQSIFRRAWEAAAASDKAEQEELAREGGAATNETKPFVTEARDEVLLKAAARDPLLAEAFLKDLLKEREAEKSSSPSEASARTPWRELSAIDGERLGYALDLLERGESNSAAQFAAPLVNRGVSADLVALIIRLREQNPAAADRLYGLLLAQARTDTSADANSVLLLSSPIISPELLVVVDERGSLQFRPLPPAVEETVKAPPVAPALRSAFYQTAAAILLRPVAPRAVDARAQQPLALYMALGRLLPYFEREAAEFAPELRARVDALAGELEQGRRDALAAHFELERVTPERAGDPLRASFEQLARAGSETERDRVRLSIVRVAARKRLWDRARRTAAEIENAASRRAALTFVAVSQVADLAHTYADDVENDYESIVNFLQGADIPALASVWGYAEAAAIAARRKDSRAALGLLDEAERHAGRVDARTRQRVAAYAMVAGVAARLDPERAWSLLYEAVKAANTVEDFSGDEVSLDITATDDATGDAPDSFSVKGETFRLDLIFATMARLDWTKALSDARALEGRVPQALVFIAMARAALYKKQG